MNILEPSPLSDVFLPTLPSAPYPGLRPFESTEWPIFFGRERMTDEVIERLLRDRLVVIHGASGDGKSSLVRAGVQVRLVQKHARSGVQWRSRARARERPYGRSQPRPWQALLQINHSQRGQKCGAR